MRSSGRDLRTRNKLVSTAASLNSQSLMPIPEFNEIKVPALQLYADGNEHRLSDVYGILAKTFQLTPEELVDPLPSGNSRWRNRVSWACGDLLYAGLLTRVKRGLYSITEAGKQEALGNPKSLHRDYLMKFPKFAEFIQKTGAKPVAATGDSVQIQEFEGNAKPPLELMASAHKILAETLKKEVLDLVKEMDPLRFEKLVLDLLLAMGYGGSRTEAANLTKASHDEGIDGVINEDRLGLDVIYVQAKRWQQTVGRKEIQSFVGALAGQQANKGVFITTSEFAQTATNYAKQVSQKVILIDGDRLADLMTQYNIGVTLRHSYEIKHVDGDYFENE